MSARSQSFEISWLWLNSRYKQRIFDCFSWCSALYFPSTFVNLWKLQFVSWYFVIEKISVWNYHYNRCSSETYLAINSLNVLFECFVLFWFFFSFHFTDISLFPLFCQVWSRAQDQISNVLHPGSEKIPLSGNVQSALLQHSEVIVKVITKHVSKWRQKQHKPKSSWYTTSNYFKTVLE